MEEYIPSISCYRRSEKWKEPERPIIENVGVELTIKHSCGGDVTLNQIYENDYDISHELVCSKCGWKKELHGVDG